MKKSILIDIGLLIFITASCIVNNFLFASDKKFFIPAGFGRIPTNRVYIVGGVWLISIAIWLGFIILLQKRSRVAAFIIKHSDNWVVYMLIATTTLMGIWGLYSGFSGSGVPNP